MSQYQHTFRFKRDHHDDEETMEADVDRDGNLIEARIYCPFFDEWADRTERVKESRYWMERIKEAHADYDWPEHIAQERWGA